MLPEYRKLIQQAQSRSAENKKFLDRLKKLKPNDLDRHTHRLHDEAFEQIDCLKCANCCSSTGPLLLAKDIERLARALRIKPSAFAEQYLREDEDGDQVFQSMPCPFLGADHYCSVYEHRPNACREYPHTQQRDVLKKLKITWHNSMICPAVAEVLEGLKRLYV